MGELQLMLQMCWDTNLLSQTRRNGPPVGLKNLGNSCYLNSVLQCLTHTPPLANFCLQMRHSVRCQSASSNGQGQPDCAFCILEKRIMRSLKTNLTVDAPTKIQRSIKLFASHFRLGHQEDAHEFLHYLIDACHSACFRSNKSGTKSNHNSQSIFTEIFGGSVKSKVTCLSCNHESNKIDEIMDISLDILHSNSIEESLENFFRSEILDGGNRYHCENCKKLVAARKQMSIFEAPNVLIIQVKRFEAAIGAKINKFVTFNEVLSLSRYTCKASQDASPEYTLFGTIIHAGLSRDTGHYYTYIKDASGKWYCCNDTSVTASTLDSVLSEKVYLLFYIRDRQRLPARVASSARVVPESHNTDPKIVTANGVITGSKSSNVDVKCGSHGSDGPNFVGDICETNGASTKEGSTACGRGPKRKFGASALLSQDPWSKAEVERWKEILSQEAYSALRSSGWTRQVHDFMLQTKKAYTQDAYDDKKKRLISGAKATFLSEIPVWLKEQLITHLRDLSSEK